MINTTNRKNSIAIFAIYFGPLPWYFNFFIHSCKFNKSIDFILICDTKLVGKLPANVKHVYYTLSDLNVIASKKLGIQTSIQNGYKFCDFKPAYGYLFSELVEGYAFWGQSDIDVIFGNLRGFLNPLLGTYDYISVRHDFPTGFFSVFRNVPLINEVFKQSIDYKKVLSDDRHYCFDECNNVHALMTLGKSIFEVKTEIESFMHIVKRAEARNEIKLHFDFICLEGITGRITFDNGRVIYKNQYEAILYHLIAFKQVCKPTYTNIIPNKYRISPSKICFK